jgi:hypothetical protein
MKNLVLVLAIFAVTPAFAQEALGPATGGVADLDGGFPASILDTTTIGPGSWELGVTGSYLTNGTVYETAGIQVKYGIMDGLEASIGWDAVLGEGLVAGNGDTTLGVLWAAIPEGDILPSMGVGAFGSLPSGDGFTGYSGTAVGVATKTIGQARVHLNAAYTTIGDNTAACERNDADYVALGMDYPLYDNLILVVDGFSAESAALGQDRYEMVEAGVRMALSDMETLSVGVGVSVGNGNATPDFTGTIGYQRAL